MLKKGTLFYSKTLVLTWASLTGCVSEVLLDAAVLIQSHDEPRRQPCQLHQLWAVELPGHQHVLRGRALELQLQLGQVGLRPGARRLLLSSIGQEADQQHSKQEECRIE